jgi:hypothetical protein
MDCKFYTSLEAARLLKEKGYDEDVRNFYDEEGLFLEVEGFYNFEYLTNEELDNNHYAAPTKAEAIDWLESKGIRVEVTTVPRGKWRWSLYSYAEMYDSLRDYYTDYETRLEAEEAAIIEACKLL